MIRETDFDKPANAFHLFSIFAQIPKHNAIRKKMFVKGVDDNKKCFEILSQLFLSSFNMKTTYIQVFNIPLADASHFFHIRNTNTVLHFMQYKAPNPARQFPVPVANRVCVNITRYIRSKVFICKLLFIM